MGAEGSQACDLWVLSLRVLLGQGKTVVASSFVSSIYSLLVIGLSLSNKADKGTILGKITTLPSYLCPALSPLRSPIKVLGSLFISLRNCKFSVTMSSNINLAMESARSGLKPQPCHLLPAGIWAGLSNGQYSGDKNDSCLAGALL